MASLAWFYESREFHMDSIETFQTVSLGSSVNRGKPTSSFRYRQHESNAQVTANIVHLASQNSPPDPYPNPKTPVIVTVIAIGGGNLPFYPAPVKERGKRMRRVLFLLVLVAAMVFACA